MVHAHNLSLPFLITRSKDISRGKSGSINPSLSFYNSNDLKVVSFFFLRILALEKLGAVFNQVAFPLQYSPRKFVIHPETNNLILIETDHNAYTEATKAQRKQQMAEVRGIQSFYPINILLLYLFCGFLAFQEHFTAVKNGKGKVSPPILHDAMLFN